MQRHLAGAQVHADHAVVVDAFGGDLLLQGIVGPFVAPVLERAVPVAAGYHLHGGVAGVGVEHRQPCRGRLQRLQRPVLAVLMPRHGLPPVVDRCDLALRRQLAEELRPPAVEVAAQHAFHVVEDGREPGQLVHPAVGLVPAVDRVDVGAGRQLGEQLAEAGLHRPHRCVVEHGKPQQVAVPFVFGHGLGRQRCGAGAPGQRRVAGHRYFHPDRRAASATVNSPLSAKRRLPSSRSITDCTAARVSSARSSGTRTQPLLSAMIRSPQRMRS